MAAKIICGIDIFTQAIKRIGSGVTPEQRVELSPRSPYLLATFCCEAKELDARYREAHGLAPAPEFNEVELDPLGIFPMSKRFTAAASAYLAAMFLIDYNSELSDKFFDIYCDEMARIESELPARLEKIAEKYL